MPIPDRCFAVAHTVVLRTPLIGWDGKYSNSAGNSPAWARPGVQPGAIRWQSDLQACDPNLGRHCATSGLLYDIWRHNGHSTLSPQSGSVRLRCAPHLTLPVSAASWSAHPGRTGSTHLQRAPPPHWEHAPPTRSSPNPARQCCTDDSLGDNALYQSRFTITHAHQQRCFDLKSSWKTNTRILKEKHY